MRSHLTPIPSPAPGPCARGWAATQRRWAAWAGLVLCLWSGFGAAAQGAFDAYNNSEVNPILAGDYTRLSVEVGRVEILYKGIVLNTSKNTLASLGTFSFGILTIPDAEPGETVTITVRAWDVTLGATYEAAEAAIFGVRVSSSTFVVLLGTAALPGNLDYFHGLTLGRPCFGTSVPPPYHAEVQEGQPVSFPWVGIGFGQNIHPPNAAYNQRPGFPVPGYPKGLALGSLAYVSNWLAYVPLPRTYGTDAVYYQVDRTGCFGIGVGTGVVFFDIQPSPSRFKPTLFIASGKPGLLALDGHRYRIEKSADLSVWTSAGEVTGNFSEVDLSPFLAPGDRAQFVRATEILKP